MSKEETGLAQDRAAFECLIMQLTGRDMEYHARSRTTGLDFAWLCYRAAVASERERCALIAAGATLWKRKVLAAINNAQIEPCEIAAAIRGPDDPTQGTAAAGF